MAKEEIRGVEKGALSFLAGTFCSRITGVMRDVMMAAFLGSSPSLAAFMVSYRFANLFRRLLGEGPLPAGFIPHFETMRQESPQKGARFFRDAFFSLALLLLFLLLLCEGGLFLWIRHGSLSLESQEIVLLTGLMMPGVVFICLYGISGALLQCEKKFFLSSVAPVCFNIVWIVGVFLSRGLQPSEAAVWLSLSVVFGFLLQWAFLLPAMKNYFRAILPWKEVFSFVPFSCDVRKVMKPLGMSIVGVGATQINNALDALFARSASLEAPAYLWYAIRIEQLPLALLGIALSSALLPSLSRAFSEKDFGQFQTLLRFSLQRSFVIMFPCMIALFCLAGSGVNLLYGRGDFSVEATRQTIYCLWGYGLGLLPAVFVLLLAPALYAQKNYRIPMQASLVSVVANICFNAVFVFGFKWGAFSVALATSLTSFGNLFLLVYALQKQGYWYGIGKSSTLIKTVLCSCFSGSVVFCVEGVFWPGSVLFSQEIPVFIRSFSDQCIQFVVLSLAFVLTFLSLAYAVGLNEVLYILRVKKRVEEGV